jgi:hypothetical protein
LKLKFVVIYADINLLPVALLNGVSLETVSEILGTYKYEDSSNILQALDVKLV